MGQAAGQHRDPPELVLALIEAGAQRYFKHSAARLTRDEASRVAAALPLPKQRAVVNPSGFTRRYGNTIEARIGVVRRDGLDSCIYD